MTDAKRTTVVDGVPLGAVGSTHLDPRIVRRYHAFEPGGAVELAREAFRDLIYSVANGRVGHAPGLIYSAQISARQLDEARAALAALDAVKEGK